MVFGNFKFHLSPLMNGLEQGHSLEIMESLKIRTATTITNNEHPPPLLNKSQEPDWSINDCLIGTFI